MRMLVWIASVGLLLGASACGGGSPDGDGASDLAVVQGKLVTRDGSSASLDGVVVTCPQTGESVTTDHQGSFQLHVPPHEPIHLGFDDPRRSGEDADHRGSDEHRDPVPDGAELDGDGVHVGPLGPRAWCDVEVHLEDGAITECHVRWGDGEDAPHAGEDHMDRDPLCDELDAAGEVEFRIEDGCLTVEVEIDGFSSVASLDVYLVDPAGEEAFVATIEIDGEGAGHLEWTWCEGDPLPFDATTPADLAGYGVVVYDESGAVVFRGHLPHHHAADVDGGHHHDGSDGEDDDHQQGGGMGGGSHHGS